MKKIIAGLVSVFIFISGAAFSMPCTENFHVVKGSVTDAVTGKPVEFVTVALMDGAGRVFAGAVTDSAGVYFMRIPKGNDSMAGDRLVFSLLGYEERSFILADLDTEAGKGLPEDAPLTGEDAAPVCAVSGGVMELGPVYLKEDARMLSGAKVSADRPLIEHKFDRLVLNVSELAVAQTGDALDVLKSSPGVTVDTDGNIKLNGSIVAVWIDGRPSNMSGADLESWLKGSDGSSIDKVELIANPSAKYDAEGSGGIINIRTRKGFLKGLSGTVGMRLGMKCAPGFIPEASLSANLMYRTDRTGTYFQYTPSFGGFLLEADQVKLYGDDRPMREESTASTRSTWLTHNISLGNDWDVTDKDILGVIFRFSASSSRGRDVYPYVLDNYIDAGTASESLYSTISGQDSSRGSNPSWSLNLNYTRAFDKARDQELTLNADYYRTDNRSSGSQRNEYVYISEDAAADGIGSYGFDEDERNVLDLWSFKADYSQSVFGGTGRFEAGVKAAYSSTKNKFAKYDFDFVTMDTGSLSERNDFRYGEQVYAAYVNLAKKFSEKWNAQAGVRGEYTIQDGHWLMASAESTRSHKDYCDFFPSLYLSYAPSRKAVLSASWSYRISRPKYWQLNPFKEYVTATSYTQGDMELEPSYSHNASLTAVLFSRFSVSTGYNRTEKFSGIQTPLLDRSTGVMGLIYTNAGLNQTAYATVSLSELPLTKWWNLTANLTWSCNRFDAYEELAEQVYGQPYSNVTNSLYASMSTTFFLPKNFKIGVDGWLSTPQSQGYINVKTMARLNFSLIKTLWDGKGILALYFYDVLNTGDCDISMENNGAMTYSIVQRQSQSGVTVGFTWRFGKSEQQRSRNVGTLEEESRL